MSDFSDPKYASYREFCRSIPDLRRSLDVDEGWKLGDWYTLDSDDEPAEPALQWGWWIGATIAIDKEAPPVVWLPSLADWRKMLRGFGISQISIEYLNDPDEVAVSAWGRVANAAVEEEAFGRLWQAIQVFDPRLPNPALTKRS